MKRNSGAWVYKIRVEKGTICCNCGEDVGSSIIMHHIVPVSIGGNNVESNIAPVCINCHKAIHFHHKKWKESVRKNTTGRPKQKHIDGYMTIQEVSECVGVSRRTVEQAIKTGKLECIEFLGFKYTTIENVSDWRFDPNMKHGYRK